MTQFSFSLIGAASQVILDVDVSALSDLCDRLALCRFFEADMVTPDGELVRVALPTGRIQLVAELGG